MRKLFIFLGIMVIGFVLTGCDGGESVKTPPSYNSIMIENTNPVGDSGFVTFYKAKQEDVGVSINITNPDNVTIKSVVINGITYNSHRFAEDSTFSNIKFALNVGTTLGETIYSVDRIYYLDGENTLFVENFTNNEFGIYVSKDMPTIERENYTVTKDTISIDFNVVDADGVIDLSTLKANIYNGDDKLDDKSIDLSLGLQTVVFSGLLADESYEVRIEASYDLDNNEGVQVNKTLRSGVYVTLDNGAPTATIENVEVDSNAVTFDVEFVDLDEVLLEDLLRVELYNGDVKLEDAKYTIILDGTTASIVFDDLLNDNEYSIKVLADYDLKNGEPVVENKVLDLYTFVTLPREVPTPQILNLNLLENSIEFDVSIDDPLGIIDEDTLIAKLYIDDVLVDSANVADYHVDLQIANLFSDSKITIELLANYDLNNGEDPSVNEIIYVEDYSTSINAAPTVAVSELLVEQGYITVSLQGLDVNDTLLGAEGEEFWAVLYEEDTEVATMYFGLLDTEIIFDYATESGLSYYIEIFASYNLRDGFGAITDDSLRRIVSFTAEAKAPIAEINDIVTDSGSITFELNVIDADDTIAADTIVVYLMKDDVVEASIPFAAAGVYTVVFDETVLVEGVPLNVLSNNEYEIVVKANYDLIDGSGLLEDVQLNKVAAVTLEKAVPTVETSNIEVTTDTISFDLLITDTDSVIDLSTVKATLYYEGNPVQEITDDIDELEEFGLLFDHEDILSDNLYTIVITGSYDLNDGVGVQDIEPLEVTQETEAKQSPTASFEFESTSKTTIVVDVRVTDLEGVTKTDTIYAVLMLDDVEVDRTVDPLDVGLNTNIQFTGLYSDRRYYVRIVSELDYNDGVVFDPLEQTIFESSLTTDAYDGIDVTVNDIVPTDKTMSIDVEISDPQSVLEGNLEAVAYDVEGGVAVASVGLSLGANTVEITGLDPATEYYIVIEADYDLNESDTITTDGELYGEYYFTEDEIPATDNLVTIESDTIGKRTATVTIITDDDEGYLTSDWITATLRQYNGDEIQSFLLTDNSTIDIDMTNLLSGNDYELVFTATYDEGEGDEPYEYIYSFTTNALETPTITIDAVEDWDSSGGSLTLDIVIGTDQDNMVNNGSWVAELYQGSNTTPVATVALTEAFDNTGVEFTGYDHTDGNTYTVVVRADVDFNKLDPSDPDSGEQSTALATRTFIDAGN